MEPKHLEKLLEIHFNFMKSEISDLKADSTEILSQVRKTNGRVTELEKWRSHQDGLKVGAADTSKKVNARVALILTVVGIVIGAIVTALWH